MAPFFLTWSPSQSVEQVISFPFPTVKLLSHNTDVSSLDSSMKASKEQNLLRDIFHWSGKLLPGGSNLVLVWRLRIIVLTGMVATPGGSGSLS
jgi:hypothetical protein